MGGSESAGLDGDDSGQVLPAENAWMSDRAEGFGRIPRVNKERQSWGN